jgi:hypothetical protein
MKRAGIDHETSSLHGWLTQPNLLCEMLNEAETCSLQTSAG